MTELSWEHAAEARAALTAIVTDPDHGVAALSSAQTMSNLLKDLLPDAPREKSILVAAAEAGLAGKLREHVDSGMDASSAIRLTASSFSISTPFTPEACSWVTGEIAHAIGIDPSGDGRDLGQTPQGFDPVGGMPTQATRWSGLAPGQGPGLGAAPGGRQDAAPSGGRGPSFGAAPAGQAPSGQAPFGQAPVGQAPVGQAPVGQAPVGQAPVGQPPFGQVTGQAYGQAYGQPADQAYGQPAGQAYGQPAGPSFGSPSQGSGQPGAMRYPPPQPGYPQPGLPAYGGVGGPAFPPAPGYPAARRNGFALAALICGIAQFVLWIAFLVPGFVAAVLSIIFGSVALRQIRRTGEGGRGMAIAGIVCSAIGIVLVVLLAAIGIATRTSQSG